MKYSTVKFPKVIDICPYFVKSYPNSLHTMKIGDISVSLLSLYDCINEIFSSSKVPKFNYFVSAFDAFVSSFPLAESPPGDLQITAYKNWSVHAYLETRSREKNGGSPPWAATEEVIKYKNKLGNRMIKQLLDSFIAKHRDLSVFCRSMIYLSLRLRQIIDLLATDKSRNFAQPRPYNCFILSL